jgi:hypothetical protein
MKICKTNPISIRTRSGLLRARCRKHARPDQCNSWEPSQEADRIWQLFIDERRPSLTRITKRPATSEESRHAEAAELKSHLISDWNTIVRVNSRWYCRSISDRVTLSLVSQTIAGVPSTGRQRTRGIVDDWLTVCGT